MQPGRVDSPFRMTRIIVFVFLMLLDTNVVSSSDEHSLDTEQMMSSKNKRRVEDAIPVVEIRGEGKPMTAAQIRALEEQANGGPLDIKIEKTWRPMECPRAAKRKDFLTFHYKAYTEDGKKFDQSYGREPVSIQLGTAMSMPGLDKGLRGMCETELRKISVPHRLMSRKRKSRVWKHILNDEHWLHFNVEMLTVQPWSFRAQFGYLDLDNDTRLIASELVKFAEKMKKDYGKVWSNEDIDEVIAAKYYIRYFDGDGDGAVTFNEWKTVTERDMATMAAQQSKAPVEGLKRDPGIGWILDFNNDGIVTLQEMDLAPEAFEGQPSLRPSFVKQEL